MTATLTSIPALFKNKYDGLVKTTVDLKTPVTGLVKPIYFQGKAYLKTFDVGFHGGVGMGRLPTAFVQPQVEINVDTRNLYGRLYIDRQAWKRSLKSGAYENLLDNQNKAMAMGFSRMMEFINIAGTATLGTIDTGGVSGTNPYTLTISTGSWNKWHWEVNMHVQIGTGQTDIFRVTAVNRATRVVTVSRITGSKVPAAGENIIWQGGDLGAPVGLRSIATGSGPYYGVTSQFRFAPRNQNASAAAITETLVSQWVSLYEEETGVSPTHIITSFKQNNALMATQFARKTYEMSSVKSSGGAGQKAVINYSGNSVMTSSGPIPVFTSNFCFDDEFYLLHRDYLEQIRVEDFGFLDEDLKMLRVTDLDQYEIRFGGYAENIFHPFFIQRHFNIA